MRALPSAFLVLLCGSPVVAQSTDVIYRYTARGKLKDQVGGVGDVNGDGFGDFAIVSKIRILRVHSGADGSVLYRYDMPSELGILGPTIRAVGDANGDGVPDFACEGTPFYQTSSLHSGVDGSVIGGARGIFRCRTLQDAGDVNQDGCDELIGFFEDDDELRVFEAPAQLGPTQSLEPNVLYRYPTAPFGVFPTGVGGEDVNGDGITDFLISNTGASMRSGHNGKILWENSVVQSARGTDILDDVDGDGMRDFAVGATNGTFILSGATGSTIWVGVSGGPLFGSIPRSAGDVDGDGRGDVLFDVYGVPGTSVVLYSGTGRRLAEYEEVLPRVDSYSGVGDVNGDGLSDWAIGWTDASGLEIVEIRAGQRLYLDVSERAPAVGDTLELGVGPGQPGGLTVTFVVEAKGAPLFQSLGAGLFDASGVRAQEFVVPAAIAGIDVKLLSLGQTATGLTSTTVEAVQF